MFRDLLVGLRKCWVSLQAEYLYACMEETIDLIIPEELDYLEKYDRMTQYINTFVTLPDTANTGSHGVYFIVGNINENWCFQYPTWVSKVYLQALAVAPLSFWKIYHDSIQVGKIYI